MNDHRTVEHALKWLRSGHVQPDHGMLDTDEKDRRARELQAAFRTYPGALTTILEMTIFRPAVDHRLPKDGRYQTYAQLREGQDQVAAAILHYLDHAERISDVRPTASASPSSLEPGRPGFSDAALTDAGVAVR